ncbi:F-box/WD repeat-containing protein 7 [Hondaea fermentalgiana]|uniref:non-specific serine/threonine protein kinase n=1 Tax=Hondaea fermentalgiana TaxID=2315210 RepID=A0A2R5GBL0_9STRA|nr:F-box/WD repeat-containing protein 7 [Hondaea fermentalgiana]|eukprot:GBG25973.1 F-box/WD repeat-containing protein 7 [Hondaea fermentalgiana]
MEIGADTLSPTIPVSRNSPFSFGVFELKLSSRLLLAAAAAAMGRIEGTVYGVAQSADLVLAASEDRYLRAWSKKDGALVMEIKVPNNQEANTVAVQGMLAAVGTDRGGLFVIDVATASVLHALRGHTGTVKSVVFDGDEIISGSSDKTLRVWDKLSGRETLRIDAKALVLGVAAHEDLLVAALSDNTVRVFDRASGGTRHILTEARGEVRAVAIDAHHLVSGSEDNKVRAYAVPSFEPVLELQGHTDLVLSVALEGNRIVSGSFDNTVRVWDARSGATLHVLHGHTDYVRSVSLFGSELVSGSGNSFGSRDYSVRVWDAETGASTRVLDGTEAARPIGEALGTASGCAPSSSASAEALKAALANGDLAELGRCKLMVVGQGAAGKTSTVRSLLGMPPVAEHVSTVGVELKRTDAESWNEIKDVDSGFERQALRAAALRLAAREKQAASRKRQSLPKRISRKASDLVFGRRTSSARRPFVAEEVVELVPEAEMAQRFRFAEIEEMAGETQTGQKIFFTIWDYAGQDVFYALHHLFLTHEGGVFMVVFDMQELLLEQEKAIEYLSIWLNSVKLHAPTAPIILVGTHYDQASVDVNVVEEILVETLSVDENENIVTNPAVELSFFPIDNMSREPDRASALRAAVEASASSLEAVTRKISLRWLKVLEDLLNLECDHVPFATVQELANQYHAGDQTDELLEFFHELGMLVHLRVTDSLHDKVVLNPQWLLDKLSRVIADEIHVKQMRHNRELQQAGLKKDFAILRKRGVATLSLLEFLWNGEEVEYLREFMQETMLISDWAFPEEALTRGRQSEPLYFVSSLLKNSADASLDEAVADMDIGLTCVLDFSKFFLPDGVFARLLSLCVQYSGDTGPRRRAPQLAGDQAIIRFGFSVFALEQTKDKIWIRLERDSDKPLSTLKTLLSMFRGARDAVFRDLPWGLLLQSPRNASVLVAYDDVVDARQSGAALVESVGTKNAKVEDFAPFFQDGSLKEDEKDTGMVDAADLPLASDLKYHVFLSHKQLEAGDACNLMAEKIANRGLKVWVDQRTEGNLSKEEMQAGIRASKCYLLFLSKTVFDSKAVCMELSTALQAGKPILLVHESDPKRVGFTEFSTYIDTVPESARHIFDDRESMPFQRRLYLAEGFYNELITRIGAC